MVSGENGDQFAGGDKVRFCSTCGKNVYNLSAMSRGVAERSLRRTGGTICTRFARSPDGRIVTEGPAGLWLHAVRSAGWQGR